MTDDEPLAGRYRRVRPLGSGGMGDVWLAEDDELGRQVAVKRLRIDVPGGTSGSGGELVERMMREARVVARLKHPAIVTLYDLVRVDGLPHLILEYVDGESLADRLARDRTTDWHSVARIIADTAAGLAAAHQAGVLHRDVKPGNVLIDPQGRGHLADFGIARGSEDVAITRAGEMIGTLAYMPPEVARQEPTGPASDIWSLGATFYAAVEGNAPFVPYGADVPSIIARLVREAPPTATRAGACTALVNRMLASDPAARPTAAEVSAELDRILSGAVPPLAETGPTPSPPVSPVTEEVRTPTAGGQGPISGSHDAPTMYGGGAQHPPTPVGPAPSPLSPEPRRRGGRIAAVLLAVALLGGAVVGVALLQGDDSSGRKDAGSPPNVVAPTTGGTEAPTRFTETLDLGPTPGNAVLGSSGNGPIYVANTADDQVTVVDRASGEVLNRIAVCDAPTSGIAVAPDGSRAFVPCGGPQVWVVDPTGVLQMIDVNGTPVLLRITADGRTVFAPERDTPDGAGEVAVIDAESMTNINAIATVGEPGLVQLTPDGAYVYTPDHDGQAVVRIKVDDQSSTTIPLDAPPNGLQVSADGARVYVTLDDSRVQVIERNLDGDADALGDAFAAPGADRGKIRVQPGTDLGWIPNLDDQNVQLVDLTDGTDLGSIATDGVPSIFGTFAPDGGTFYLAVPDAGLVLAIDTETREAAPVEGVGEGPRAITLSPDGSTLYVIGWRDGDKTRGTLTAVPLG